MNNYPHLPAVTSCPLSTQTHCNSWSCWPAPGGGEVKMGYVMLTGDDGAPKVLPSLCLHCQNGQLVCGYSWLSGSLPFCGGGLMFFPWLLPPEGWHSHAPRPPRGGGGRGEGDVAFSIWSLSALVRQSDVKEWVFFPPILHPTSPLSWMCVAPLSSLSHPMLVLVSLRSASRYTQSLSF